MPLLWLIKKKKTIKVIALHTVWNSCASGTEWIKDKERILEFSVLVQSMLMTFCFTRQGV